MFVLDCNNSCRDDAVHRLIVARIVTYLALCNGCQLMNVSIVREHFHRIFSSLVSLKKFNLTSSPSLVRRGVRGEGKKRDANELVTLIDDKCFKISIFISIATLLFYSYFC